MKRLIWLFCFLPLLTLAQKGGTGIEFTKAANWQEVLAEAEAQNKMIFVDAYTTWCGPCQYLSKEIFTRKDVGAFFNKHFVSLKLQLDTAQNDSETVKEWYGFASKIMSSMDVRVFPTLLFFDAKGNPVHRLAGAPDGAGLIRSAGEALDPETQFYTLRERYQRGEGEPGLMERLCRAALAAYQMETVQKVLPELLALQGNQLTAENASLVSEATSSPLDPGFKLITDDPEGFDQLMGKPGTADSKIRNILFSHLLEKARETKLNGSYTEAVGTLSRLYPKWINEPEARARTYYYRYEENWARFLPTATDYMKRFAGKINPQDQNELAWAVFENISDKKAINEALKWSLASLKVKDANYMDTYANLLHKAGRTPEAIQWEQKAIAAATADQKDTFVANLAKMRKGQKTW